MSSINLSFLLLNLLITCVLALGSWDFADLGQPSTNGIFSNVHRPNRPNAATLPMKLNDLQYHGTTTLCFKRKDCIVVCVDSKASVGSYVGSRCVKKLFPVSKSIVATMAGGAADCAYWIRRVATAVKGLEFKYSANFNAGAIARILSSTLKDYKGMG